MLHALYANFGQVAVYSFLATALMTTILFASQGLGLSRLNLPLLVGTFVTSRRTYANVVGSLIYALGGWIFGALYFIVFLALGFGNWWSGLLLGLAHGIVLLVVGLTLIPYVHPRMANEYEGPTRTQRLEPPGFIGLNYGFRTPASVLVAQAAYGVVLGLGFQLSGTAP